MRAGWLYDYTTTHPPPPTHPPTHTHTHTHTHMHARTHARRTHARVHGEQVTRTWGAQSIVACMHTYWWSAWTAGLWVGLFAQLWGGCFRQLGFRVGVFRHHLGGFEPLTILLVAQASSPTPPTTCRRGAAQRRSPLASLMPLPRFDPSPCQTTVRSQDPYINTYKKRNMSDNHCNM